MITRKRARISEDLKSETVTPDSIQLVSTIDHDQILSCTQFSSESEDASGVDFEDFLSLNGLNWNLEDDDELTPLLDVDKRAEMDATHFTPGVVLFPSLKIGGAVQKSEKLEDDVLPRVNKNAIAARINRLKKKEYVNGLEKKVGTLVSENSSLRQENTHLIKRVQELEDETRYLRAVLANESMLAQLLSRLSGVNGMKLSTSLFQEPNKHDHDYALPRKRVKVEEKETSGGVCLHVDKNHVSVEFCTKCAESASTSLKM